MQYVTLVQIVFYENSIANHWQYGWYKSGVEDALEAADILRKSIGKNPKVKEVRVVRFTDFSKMEIVTWDNYESLNYL